MVDLERTRAVRCDVKPTEMPLRTEHRRVLGMTDLLAPIAVIAAQIVGFALMLRVVRSRSPSWYRKTNFEIRSLSGRNAAMVLSTLAVAKLLSEYQTVTAPHVWPTIGLVAVAVVVALLLLRRLGPPLVSTVGLLAFWTDAFVTGDAETGLWFVAISILMLIVLGLLHPLLGD